MQMIKLSVIALAVAAASTQMAVASQQSESNGFIEDSSLNAHARTLYFNRDFRNTPKGTQSYREDLGLGLKAIYESGFTQGTVGFGVDAFGLQGIKLDSGRGRNGNGQFPTHSNGKAQDNYSQAGGAVKARISNTTLKYGQQFVDLPVLSTDDSRLLPESTTGFLVTSNEIENLELHAGHFTALSAQEQTSQDSNLDGNLRSLDLVGGRYNLNDDLSAAYYYSDASLGHKGAGERTAKKHYTNVNYTLSLAEQQSLNFDFNMYNTKFKNKDAPSSKDSNNIWSLAAAYTLLDAHTFTVAHQRSTGGNDNGYEYGYDGGGAVYLANSVQIHDFEQSGEKSFQARYDLDMATFGVPGLSFMTRYVRGTNIENGNRNNGKNWERDTEAKYVLQSGAAKDLSFRVRQATYRANDAANYTDINEVRLIVEYPLSIL
ncbi:OprD family porin [Denitrificimonas caeni]|uniref:OprD family porin n=1 Tax=Denitrificimonas caeni TaxID=521720 RepID=UPI001963E6E0|nr:OprD family porin [Denitrificimonas caeni]